MANTSAATNANTNPRNQHRFFRISLNQYSGRNGHNTIRNEEGKREKTCDSNTQIKTVNDIRYQWPKYVGQKGNNRKNQKDQRNNDQVGLHNVIIYSYLLFGRRLQDFNQCSTCLANKIPQNATIRIKGLKD